VLTLPLTSATHHIESISAGIWCEETSQEETNKHYITCEIFNNSIFAPRDSHWHGIWPVR